MKRTYTEEEKTAFKKRMAEGRAKSKAEKEGKPYSQPNDDGSVSLVAPTADKISVGADFTRPDPLVVVKKENGMSYRWLDGRPDNIAKKKAEGWQIVTGTATEGVAVNQSTDTSRKFGDLILAKMPMERAKARSAFYNKQTDALLKVKTKGKRLETGLHRKYSGDVGIEEDLSAEQT